MESIVYRKFLSPICIPRAFYDSLIIYFEFSGYRGGLWAPECWIKKLAKTREIMKTNEKVMSRKWDAGIVYRAFLPSICIPRALYDSLVIYFAFPGYRGGL